MLLHNFLVTTALISQTVSQTLTSSSQDHDATALSSAQTDDTDAAPHAFYVTFTNDPTTTTATTTTDSTNSTDTCTTINEPAPTSLTDEATFAAQALSPSNPAFPTPSPPTTTPPSPSPTHAFAYVIPTSLLSQIPPSWPYTAYGMGRKAGVVTWVLTDGDGEGKERKVAEVRHRMQWLGRPLRREDERGGLEGLEGWRRTFVVPRTRVDGEGDEKGVGE